MSTIVLNTVQSEAQKYATVLFNIYQVVGDKEIKCLINDIIKEVSDSQDGEKKVGELHAALILALDWCKANGDNDVTYAFTLNAELLLMLVGSNMGLHSVPRVA